MERSPAEFKVGRWSWHSCLRCQVEGGDSDPSESTILPVSSAPSAPLCLCLKGDALTLSRNSFLGQTSPLKPPEGVWTYLEGSSFLPSLWQEPEKNRKLSVHMDRCQGSLDAREEASKSCLMFRWEAEAAEPKTCSLWHKTEHEGEKKKQPGGFSYLENLNEPRIVQLSVCFLAACGCSAIRSGVFHLNQ